MRHGKVQPFKVATGRYGRPVGGSSGARMSAPVAETISGSAASALLPTVAAATASPAPLKNLRVTMVSSFGR